MYQSHLPPPSTSSFFRFLQAAFSMPLLDLLPPPLLLASKRSATQRPLEATGS